MYPYPRHSWISCNHRDHLPPSHLASTNTVLDAAVCSCKHLRHGTKLYHYPIRHHETLENLPWMQPEAQWPHVHRSQATQWHPHWPNDHRIDPVLLWKQKDSGRSTWPDQQTFSKALRCVFYKYYSQNFSNISITRMLCEWWWSCNATTQLKLVIAAKYSNFCYITSISYYTGTYSAVTNIHNQNTSIYYGSIMIALLLRFDIWWL